MKLLINPNTTRLLHTRGFLSKHSPCSWVLVQPHVPATTPPHTKMVTTDAAESHKHNATGNQNGSGNRILYVVAGVVFGGSCLLRYLVYSGLNPVRAESAEAEASQVEPAAEIETGALHKSEAGFKERKIIEYENRIRSYSTPDKAFRYFASMQDAKTGVIYMNPGDFVRALTPDTMQPKGMYHLSFFWRIII